MTSDSSTLPVSNLIDALPSDARNQLAIHGEFHQAQPGDTILEQGKSRRALLYLISGEFEARREDQGQTLVLGKIPSGEWVGEVDLIDGGTAVCSVVATLPSHYWWIERDSLDAFIQARPADGNILLNSLALVLCRRIRDVTRKLAWRSLIS